MPSTTLMKAWCIAMKRFKESTVDSFYFLSENIKHATSSLRAFDEMWFEVYQFNTMTNANGANVLSYQLFMIDRFSTNIEKTYLIDYVEKE